MGGLTGVVGVRLLRHAACDLHLPTETSTTPSVLKHTITDDLEEHEVFWKPSCCRLKLYFRHVVGANTVFILTTGGQKSPRFIQTKLSIKVKHEL